METMQYTSGHIHPIEAENGDLVDIVTFCSDWCHQQWCRDTGTAYEGWYGCMEMQSPSICASCESEI